MSVGCQERERETPDGSSLEEPAGVLTALPSLGVQAGGAAHVLSVSYCPGLSPGCFGVLVFICGKVGVRMGVKNKCWPLDFKIG